MVVYFDFLGKKVKSKRERMRSMVKKERNTTLVDVVFSWSINDIMNNDLYENKVNAYDLCTFLSFPNLARSLNLLVNIMQVNPIQ